MADPQQQPAKPSTPEFLLDAGDLLTAEDQAALDAEQTDEPVAEPAPEGLPAKPPQPPAPQQADATEKPKEPRKQKPSEHVPYERFEAVTERARKAEEALARLDERRKIAQEAEDLARQQPVEVPSKLGARPDAAIDPIGADLYDVKRENEILAYRLEQNERGVGLTAQQVEQSRQQQEFANWVNNDAATYRSQHPDYDAEVKRAYAWRVQSWMDSGETEAVARAIVDQEAVAKAMLSRKNGRSAAEGYYKLAKQINYQMEGAEPPAALAPLTPEVQPSPAQQGKERLNQVRQGQKFQGLSRVPAENPANIDWSNMDAQTLADMPEEEFLERINDPVQGPQLRKALQRLELGA